MKEALIFRWGVSPLFGWGVYGLNLMRHWPRVADGASAWSSTRIDEQALAGLNPLELRALGEGLAGSAGLCAALAERAGQSTRFDGVVLNGLNTMAPPDIQLTGRITGGVTFIEKTDLPGAADAARDYTLIIAGSSWNEALLRANGVTNVTTVLQGVDPTIFHPAPRAGALEGRFAVFSGGKLEFRKGQDMVLLAFRAFAQRHPEAILVTAWHSPWPQLAITLNGPHIAPVPFDATGAVRIADWAVANGIPADQVIDLGGIPNYRMAGVLREMDVALFPNRCEGGTNLVAMECMACGLPVIVSNNTGHKDLVATGAPFVLARQRPVPDIGGGTEGWGESDVEEMVEALETAWRDRDQARRRGEAGAAAMAGWNWRQQVGRLHDALAPFSS